ncbi:MAG: hypothetical protein ABIE22_01120 [archaeon]
MCLWRKNCWCLGIIFFSVLSLAAGQNITLDYPSEVYTGEDFSIGLELQNFSEDIYDVKIDIKIGDNRIAQILDDNQWKSTFYYVVDVVNLSKANSKSFSLNITGQEVGVADIEVKIRNSQDHVETFSGYKTNVSIQNGQVENPPGSQDNEKISIIIETERRFHQNEELKVKASFKNLKDLVYDLKVYLADDEEVVSEILLENSDNWQSSFYYFNGAMDGPGSRSRNFRLRLKKDYENYKGDLNLTVKLRYGGDIFENSTRIYVLEREEVLGGEMEEENGEIENISVSVGEGKEVPEIIYLNSPPSDLEEVAKDINTEKIYKTRSGEVKEYALFGFGGLCVLIIIYLLLRKNI